MRSRWTPRWLLISLSSLAIAIALPVVRGQAAGEPSLVTAADGYQQQTALMWAATEGHADAVKTLLDAGADPNRKDRVTTIDGRKHADHPTGGMTALMFAAREGHADTVTALVKGGADPK